jgi:hypothetical protein
MTLLSHHLQLLHGAPKETIFSGKATTIGLIKYFIGAVEMRKTPQLFWDMDGLRQVSTI